MTRVKAGDLNPPPRMLLRGTREWVEINKNSILDTEQLCALEGCNNIIDAKKRWSKNNRNKNKLGFCERACYLIYKKEEYLSK